ncbi:accessory factor UbiK family protein [Halomonas sabkhae]|uniref:accessory factor UbiK family protein n=1 Tax=Halomonas sabkhae TaxID=626223 RepID=UPI0025B2DF6C|nr:accessory factor UbiK family protein [Halomonas sabkhae]MDN3525086.1 accessory factor UbiK family protein [Halomonas sabkhae]
MVSQDRIGRLAQQIGERLQGASQAPEDVQKGVHQVVKGAFDRLELVSREDFDILMDVLQRTRGRVEALEQQVAALEDALDASVAASDPDAEEVSEPALEAGTAETPHPGTTEASPEQAGNQGADDTESAHR